MIILTDEQKKTVRQWVTEGANLSEIQKRIGAEFKIPVTFMEVRFLILDLELKIKESASKAAPQLDLSKSAPAETGADAEPPEGPGPAGGVSVELDRVVKAGAIVSGTVTFSGGQKAFWTLDQLGRLGLSAGKAGYRPSEEDLQAFQQELARLIQNRGF